MKLSDLRPCFFCSGRVTPIVIEIKASRHFIRPIEANQALGLAQYFQGNLALAEAFTGHADVTVQIEPEVSVLACGDCFAEKLSAVYDMLLSQPMEGVVNA